MSRFDIYEFQDPNAYTGNYGVFHDGDRKMAVCTDGKVAVAMNDFYSEEHKGTRVCKNGQVYDSWKYSHMYHKVLFRPSDGTSWNIDPKIINEYFQQSVTFCKENGIKPIWQKENRCQIRFGKWLVSAYRMKKILDFMKYEKFFELAFIHESEYNQLAMVMPPNGDRAVVIAILSDMWKKLHRFNDGEFIILDYPLTPKIIESCKESKILSKV